MTPSKALQKRLDIMRDRATESLDYSWFLAKKGKNVASARQQGRFQAYYDSWFLLNDLLNLTKKGGD